jgi:hypothetical protein
MAPQTSDVGADTAVIVAALERLVCTVRDERAVLARLRSALGDMHRALARAKAVADSETAAALLDEFEHRVDAMIEIAGRAEAAEAAPVAEPVAETIEQQPEAELAVPEAEQATPEALHMPPEAEQVPTVSGVMSPPGSAVTFEPEPFHDPSGDSAPTVAMLTAMVEALRDAIPAEPEPPAAVETEPAMPAATEAEPAWPLAEAPVEPAPVVAELPPDPVAIELEAEPVIIAAEPAAMAVEEIQATAVSLPALEFAATVPELTRMRESSLLASMEQIEARPIPPPEEGTAVIFTARSLPEPPTLPAEPEPVAEAEPAEPMQFAEPELPTEPEPLAEPTESMLLAGPDRLAEPEPLVEPEPAPQPVAAEPAPATAAEADFDPSDFLFGPEPEPDPAAFLLEPARPAPTPPAAATPATPEPSAAAADQPPLDPAPPDSLATAPHDPLRALKAMSPEERLAIFS